MKRMTAVALLVLAAGWLGAAGQTAPAAKRSPFASPAKSKPAAKKPAAAAAAPARAATAAPKGKRDPFVNPVVRASGGGMASCTGGGKKCLSIGEIALQGVVKSQNGMIAVVVNSAKKTYFLRENDPVFNGYVVKITGDSVVFREQATDNLGKPMTRDVVKKVAPPA